MKKIVWMMLALIAFTLVLVGAGCKKQPPANRAITFALWAEPKARCVAFVNAEPGGTDTALCEVKGINHWCAAPAAEAPSCKPYGAAPAATAERPSAPPQAEAPTPTPDAGTK